jgi:hypothetical protein
LANRTRRRWSGRTILVSLLVLLVLLWCGYWYAANRVAQAGIERVVAATAQTEGRLTCADAGIGGFPLSLDLHCNNGVLAGRLIASLSGASATALLYRPGHVEATLTGPLKIEAPQLGGDVAANWSTAAGTIDVGLSGLSRASGTLGSFALEAAHPSPDIPFDRISVDQATFTLAPADGDDYRLAGSASELAFRSETRPALPDFNVDVSLLAQKFGGAIGLDPAGSLRAWVDKGGALKVERLAFTAGAISATATGDLTLAPTGYLSGSLVVNMIGLEKLPDLAEALKPGSRAKVAKAIGGIIAFTKPATDGSGAREIDLLIDNGVIFAGMFPIPGLLIPPIKLQ